MNHVDVSAWCSINDVVFDVDGCHPPLADCLVFSSDLHCFSLIFLCCQARQRQESSTRAPLKFQTSLTRTTWKISTWALANKLLFVKPSSKRRICTHVVCREVFFFFLFGRFPYPWTRTNQRRHSSHWWGRKELKKFEKPSEPTLAYWKQVSHAFMLIQL